MQLKEQENHVGKTRRNYIGSIYSLSVVGVDSFSSTTLVRCFDIRLIFFSYN